MEALYRGMEMRLMRVLSMEREGFADCAILRRLGEAFTEGNALRAECIDDRRSFNLNSPSSSARCCLSA